MAWEAGAWWDDNGMEEEGEFGGMPVALVEREQVSRVSGWAAVTLRAVGPNSSRWPLPLAQLPD